MSTPTQDDRASAVVVFVLSCLILVALGSGLAFTTDDRVDGLFVVGVAAFILVAWLSAREALRP